MEINATNALFNNKKFIVWHVNHIITYHKVHAFHVIKAVTNAMVQLNHAHNAIL